MVEALSSRPPDHRVVNRLACTELVELASDYLDGGPGDGTRALVTDHLIGCRACANYVGELRTTIRLVSELPAERLPVGLEHRLLVSYREWVASGAA